MSNQTASTNASKKRSGSKQPDGLMISGKVPPNAVDIEKAILGAVMLDKRAIDEVQELLHPDCFYSEANKAIFRAMQSMNERGVPIDLLTIFQELTKMELLDTVGGPYYITTLQNDVVSTANLETHCRIVLQKFMQRELIRVGMQAASAGYDESADVFDSIDKVETEMLEIANKHLRKDFTTMDKGMVRLLKKIEELRNQDTTLTGVPCGIPSIDRITHGWQPTDLIILAARPSVGKTAFALNLVKHAAMNNVRPVPVGMFSLEMSELQLNQRMLSAESRIHLERIKTGKIDNHQREILHNAAARLGNAKIFIDDNAALNMFELRAKARRMVNKHHVGLLVIDYLQLMSGDSSSKNREQEISKISRELKKLAKDLNVPVIALSQMSREVEKRADKEPQLSDLRESGAIEQDADMVMFAYRPSDKDIIQDPDLKGKGMIKIAKHRNGSLDDFVLGFKGEIQLWHELGQLDEQSSWKPVKQMEVSIDQPEDLPF